MAIKNAKELDKGKMKIDLRGPNGNAYFLLGTAKNLCKQLGKDSEVIIKEMMSSDYENLLKVFDREFGEFVDLYR